MQSLVDGANRVRPARATADEAAWRSELRSAVRDPRTLVEALDLDPQLAIDAEEAGFPTLAPWPFIRRMRPSDPRDPLLLQVLPRPQESGGDGLPADAVGDLQASRVDGLVKKYDGRALLMASRACAVHCRYCFRRHFPYETLGSDAGLWDEPLEFISADPSIAEVILSGGDPLTLSDKAFGRLVERVDSITHVKRIRLHTRLPIVIPSRVTESLTERLGRTRASQVIVLHINHANEIDAEVAKALRCVRSTGALLLNQAVLLRSVNDSVEAQRALSDRLIEVGVTPYYLHALDRVPGVAHFGVDDHHGENLIDRLRSTMPGYMVPRFVRELPGESSKRVLR